MSRVSFLKSALLIAALVLTGTESNAQAQTEVELVRGWPIRWKRNPAHPQGGNLGEWKQSHQNYVIDGYTPGDAEFGIGVLGRSLKCRSMAPDYGCARLISIRLLFEFSPGFRPAAARFWAPSLGECRLGVVWYQIQDADRPRSETLQRQVRESLTNRLASGDHKCAPTMVWIRLLAELGSLEKRWCFYCDCGHRRAPNRQWQPAFHESVRCCAGGSIGFGFRTLPN